MNDFTTGIGGINNVSTPTTNTSVASSNPLNALFTNSLLVPKHKVQQVTDEREIYSIPMGTDSSDFILHSTKPLIYFVATDNAGNKTSIIPFDIQQHISEPEPTMQDVRNIENKLEERLSSFKSEISNEISNLITTKLEEALG